VILHRVTWNGGKVSRTEISLVMLQPINRMKSFWFSAWSLAIALVLTSCGQPERPKTAAIVAQPFRVAGDFNEVGKVTFFQGESCASQIMFVFHSGRSTSISLAAPFRVSKILTDAAHDRRTVHVWGKWRRGKGPGCSYVEATQVEVQKSFW
jgi:hypothetical protein